MLIAIEKSAAPDHVVRVVRELNKEEAEAELAGIDQQLLAAKTALAVKRAIEAILYAKKDPTVVRPGV